MDESIGIRKMELKDCEKVAAIDMECIANAWNQSDFENALMRSENQYWVLEREGEIIGFTGMIVSIDEADITHIAVLPAYRGQHLGILLMQEMFAYAKENNLCAIHLEVREHNERANCFYRRLSFETLGIRKKYYRNPVEDAIIMVKYL